MKFNHYQFHYDLHNTNINNPVIIFLHGFLGDGNEFNQAIAWLSEQFCCLTIDLPGHGKTIVTGKDECYNMPNTAQALINLLDTLSIEKCFLVGYSLGGRLALYLTIHFPERFDKVVLESASAGLKNQEERLKRIQSDLQIAQELATGNFLDFLIKWYSNPLFASLTKHPDFPNILEHRLQNNPLTLAKSLRHLSLGIQPSLWNKLKENQIPLLLLVGEDDRKFQIINTEMARLCHVASLKIIRNSGHNIHLENCPEFVKSIKEFFLDSQ